MVLEMREIERTFNQGNSSIEVLKGINLQINAGETVALVGPSGSGKTTLLQIAGLLERVQIGEIFIGGHSTQELHDDLRTSIRREQIGFVYQYHHLLAEFSARENIIIPQKIARIKHSASEKKADKLLDIMGLSNRANHRPAALSGGEQQRVAIARAVANDPKLLLADEPTGNLDMVAAEVVFQLLKKLVKSSGLGALIATHNIELAKKMDRIVYLENGLLI
jgi:lipoprotein-releasing system ATP-binding protein